MLKCINLGRITLLNHDTDILLCQCFLDLELSEKHSHVLMYTTVADLGEEPAPLILGKKIAEGRKALKMSKKNQPPPPPPQPS